ncbi:HAD-IA family hydrolase [Bradyrhizobium roseum]|uniref:HAD-IA family hydrolase n=1 Tax=Bradyrhizobium roseum TaxID=3056648 RepID=UPI002622545D|nr:HAD-IA family hydrolase [Bradyrhizobium roseus]WKA31709.1 HAD-IA family hydrolase [Bradyrhizobium roseus]
MNLPLTPSSVDVLLFDLGRVVLDINFDSVMATWAGHAGCAPAELASRFVVNDSFKHHETGRIDDAAFFADLRRSLGIGLSDAQFLEGWNAIFAGEMPGIAPLLADAAQRLPLYAFSNTNPAHVAHFSKTYAGVLGHFREIFLSSSIGLRKPDAEAYDHVVKAIGVPASRILFFDDSAANIEGARARGLRAVHVTSMDDVAQALTALEV